MALETGETHKVERNAARLLDACVPRKSASMLPEIKVAVVPDGGAGATIQTVPSPVLSRRGALLRIAACGLDEIDLTPPADAWGRQALGRQTLGRQTLGWQTPGWQTLARQTPGRRILGR